MNILLVAPSGSRFNHTLHYRYTDVGEVLGFLSRKRPQDSLAFIDCLACEIEWSLLRRISEGIDVLVFYSDVSASSDTVRLASMARALQPQARILAYGKGPACIPPFFTRWPFDAVCLTGDPEAALLGYLNHLEGGPVPRGLWCAHRRDTIEGGEWLSPCEWGFPSLDCLPLEDYRRIARIKGIPFELSVYPSRGCSHRECGYCDAPRYEGHRDRRRPPDQLLAWTDVAVHTHGFDCVQMHATDFCAAPDWVERFCQEYRASGCRFDWTCCVRADSLTPALVRQMAHAGCRRIGVGVEHLSIDAVPTACEVKVSLTQLEQVAALLRENGLPGKAYLMAGMPGQTELDLLHAYLTVLRMGLIPRVSTYTPFHHLLGLSLGELEQLDLVRYDRKCFLPAGELPDATVLNLILRPPGVEAWAQMRFAELLNEPS